MLYRYAEYNYAECHFLFIVILSILMLGVVLPLCQVAANIRAARHSA
jgi:hypothetical protein